MFDGSNDDIGCGTIAVIVLVVFIAITGISTCAYLGQWGTETAQVVHQEFSPQAALTKYEWFKDAAAALDAKQANIRTYQQKFQNLKEDYHGEPRSKWSRDDREQYNLWQSEVSGVIASYNDLAADYNAQMAKFNWRFANRGELPQGASEPLPREFKPYLDGEIK